MSAVNPMRIGEEFFHSPVCEQLTRENAQLRQEKAELAEALGVAQATINCAGISTPKTVREVVEKYADLLTLKETS